MLTFTKTEDLVVLTGGITEDLDLEQLGLSACRVRMDMGGVTLINSTGVRAWMATLERLELQVTYVNCSQPVVEQANMVRGFLGVGAVMESFQVPCVDIGSGEEVVVVLKSGEHFTPGKRPDIDFSQLARPGQVLESEVDLETYLHFVGELSA